MNGMLDNSCQMLLCKAGLILLWDTGAFCVFSVTCWWFMLRSPSMQNKAVPKLTSELFALERASVFITYKALIGGSITY